ncbi:NUDIX hydrolase [Streptomyces sp. NBC_01092]|uniref:NUDIX hydrolase n=1 Tax=Streptomyces sp. NBC_01092 TaxID=2903748 RepID=UPI00386328B4|nr:NUDIX hydrolase [Streptomyces sp. NBC_01092]
METTPLPSVTDPAEQEPASGVDSEAGVTWIPREEWIKTQPQALIAACVVLLDRQDRILLLRYGTGQPNAGHWWLPGGMLDHGEDPRTAAWRETHEETGVEISTELRLIGVDHRVNVCGTGPVLDCFFHGGTLTGEAQIRLSPEHDQYAFFKADELQDMMLAAPARTLQALHEAATSGTAVYLREGQPV